MAKKKTLSADSIPEAGATTVVAIPAPPVADPGHSPHPNDRTTHVTVVPETPFIEVYGARVHNLKNLSLKLPRHQLVVFTGISGSGKSSLAFDTIYAEGQRRYTETFSAYARTFLGGLERPDVDKIEGLSPVISIEQKTTSRNPRSTVGTITEVYDFLRLLYARTAIAYSYATGEAMVRQSDDQIVASIQERFPERRLVLLAPVVKGRKGHYRELFEQLRKSGYLRARVDGELRELVPKMQLDRYKMHDIEVMIDKLVVNPEDRYRISQSVQTALGQGKGTLLVQNADSNQTAFFSRFLMDPATGLAYDDPAPNTFSFNSPYGACPTCAGLGEVREITEESIIPDPSYTLARGALVPLGEYRDIWIFQELTRILKRFKATLTTPINKLTDEARQFLLHGPTDEDEDDWEGLIPYLKKQLDSDSENIREWMQEFTRVSLCPECGGFRLKKEALHFKLDGRHIGELSLLDMSALQGWLTGLEDRLNERQNVIARELLKEIRKRLGFLLDVGLDYLTLHRPVRTLSGGESQRIRLATQIGTQLVGVLYIMDEPSIGLHQRDNERLIGALQRLRDIGNSVIVVEHDKDMILAADHVLDIGPGAGIHG
ncbi:MAG: excinuclease ABC subunit UvrA, partial [Hymenobacteraceae bacterium]|nr:excinuclease ABC subunit UvrA [Hymenobacteraceae bacterium]